MRISHVSLGVFIVATGCATLPTTVHNPTAPGFAGEIGPLAAVKASDEDADQSSSEAKEKTKTASDAGMVALLQASYFYTKIDVAPFPGMWVGAAMTDPTPGRFGWYPGIEFTGSANTNSDTEESKDGFLEDEAGNRYLYEVKRTHSGFGIGLPQLFEVYPFRKFALYLGVLPAYMHDQTKTDVEIVYENDRRLVLADPELDAKFSDIQTYERRNDANLSRWTAPVTFGTRFQVGQFQARLAFTTRRMDSTKNYDSNFRDVFLFTVGYVAKGGGSSSGTRRNPPPPRPPASGPGTTTTTTTTSSGTTTTTTTTTPAAPAPAPARPIDNRPGIQLNIPLR